MRNWHVSSISKAILSQYRILYSEVLFLVFVFILQRKRNVLVHHRNKEKEIKLLALQYKVLQFNKSNAVIGRYRKWGDKEGCRFSCKSSECLLAHLLNNQMWISTEWSPLGTRRQCYRFIGQGVTAFHSQTQAFACAF